MKTHIVGEFFPFGNSSKDVSYLNSKEIANMGKDALT
jgi:hypothetical protein